MKFLQIDDFLVININSIDRITIEKKAIFIYWRKMLYNGTSTGEFNVYKCGFDTDEDAVAALKKLREELNS